MSVFMPEQTDYYFVRTGVALNLTVEGKESWKPRGLKTSRLLSFYRHIVCGRVTCRGVFSRIKSAALEIPPMPTATTQEMTGLISQRTLGRGGVGSSERVLCRGRAIPPAFPGNDRIVDSGTAPRVLVLFSTEDKPRQ